jgi:exodeoxyribonuclease III
MAMGFSVATWNINSVRLRIDNVCRYLKEQAPDVLCLQETKCPQGQFPSSPLKELGYAHIAEFGQKGYHGVAIVSRLPLSGQHSHDFCKKGDSRHVSVRLDVGRPVILHNFYIPAGGDEPDPEINEKFAHKLQFLDELKSWTRKKAVPDNHEAILVGDLNIAPLVEDVWSHKDLLKVVSHTPVETEALTKIQAAGNWHDVMRKHVPPSEKLYTWWSYRAKDWLAADRGRRLDHIWTTEALALACSDMQVHKEARGWTQPSDHAPVLAHFSL